MAAKTDQNVGDEHYKKSFSTSKQLEEMEDNPSGSEASGSSPKAPSKMSTDVKKMEEQTGTATWKTNELSGRQTDPGRRRIGWVRHGSAYGFLVGLIVLGVWYASVFAPNILLVNIKEMFTNDLADATIALYTYDKKMMDHKLGGADCGDKESIKCKLSTMSRNDVKRFERAGFTVNGDKVEEDNLDDKDFSNDKPESRYKVTSIDFPHGGGSASSADEFEKNAGKSNNMKALAYSVWHPKSSFFQDERYKQRIKWRYDLTKQITVTGDKEEDVAKSFDASMEGEEEYMDDAGGGNYSLRGLSGDVGKNGLKKTSERIANQAYSYVGNQCAYYSQVKASYATMKKAKSVTVARFAMQYLKAADQIKAGLAEEVAANLLSSKLAWSDDGSYFGKNATDGAMYRNIVFNEPAKNETGWLYTLDTSDAAGIILPPWLITVFITQQAVKGIAKISDGNLGVPGSDMGLSARKYCLEGQKDSNKAANKTVPDCPALTIAGTPAPMVPAVGGFAAFSAITCPPIPRGGWWMMEPASIPTVKTVMPFIGETFNTVISEWAKNNDKNFTSDTKGRNAAEALFAGTGEILGDMAMSRGMKPGNERSMSEYLALKPAIDKEYETVARHEARQNQFNMYNQYSFMGSFIRSFTGDIDENNTPLSGVGATLSAIPSSFQQIAASQDSAKAFYHLQPLKFDSSRLSCSDSEYEHIGIKADTLCNVRYSMSSKDLGAKVKDVLDYMLKDHPDETKKNVEELQKRLDETDRGLDTQDKAEVQRQLDVAKEGNSAKMIDEKTGAPIRHSEYDKFMTYCVNRQNAWGRTSMAAQYEELSDDEKEERRQFISEGGIRIQGYKGDPYEEKIAENEKLAYMAVQTGASADQDWYTGKKCLEESDMLHNFRAYTMMCSVDGSHAGSIDCTEKDNATHYFDGFYHNNDVLFTSWW